MTLILLLAAAHAAPCEQTTAPSELRQALESAEDAFARMDVDTFDQARSLAERRLECLDQRLTSAIAASFHRGEALAAFIAEDDDAVIASYAAALAIEPDYALPGDVAPPGHPLVDLFEAAGDATWAERGPVPPSSLELVVDGQPGARIPADVPYILQGLDRNAVRATTYVPVGAPFPEWAREAPLEVARDGGAKGPGTALFVASGVSGATAGVLYGVAWASRGKYLDEDTPREDLEAIRARTNAVTVGSAVAGGVGLGLLGTALVVSW